jgi:hypothetical protein
VTYAILVRPFGHGAVVASASTMGPLPMGEAAQYALIFGASESDRPFIFSFLTHRARARPAVRVEVMQRIEDSRHYPPEKEDEKNTRGLKQTQRDDLRLFMPLMIAKEGLLNTKPARPALARRFYLVTLSVMILRFIESARRMASSRAMPSTRSKHSSPRPAMASPNGSAARERGFPGRSLLHKTDKSLARSLSSRSSPSSAKL